MKLVLQREKFYDLLVDAIEGGVAYGYMRAHKHNDSPDEATLLSTISEAVVSEIFLSFEIQSEDEDDTCR